MAKAVPITLYPVEGNDPPLTFPSLAAAKCECCQGKSYLANGFQWKNHGDSPPGKFVDPRFKKVRQLTLTGVPIQEFNSMKEAAKLTGASAINISYCCRGNIKGVKQSGGYRWEWVI